MKFAHYLLLLLFAPVLAFGQGAVAEQVTKAVVKNDISEYSLVTATDQDLKDLDIPADVLTEGLIVSLDREAIRNLQQERPEVLSLTFPLPDQGDVVVTLIPNKVLSDGFVLTTSSGRSVDYTPGLYYAGILNGDPTAVVALSVFDNELHGLISTEYGNYVIGIVEGAPNSEHLIYNDRYFLQPQDLDCATPDDGEAYSPSDLEYSESRAVGDCIQVYIEIDDDIVTNKGGVVGATNYVTGVFNETITLYANESLEMGISEIKAWDTPAPYSGSSSSAMLSSYQSNTGSFNGDLSHLVSYQASGGIAAGFAGICNSNVDNSKCFSSIDASYSTVPTYSFTVMVVTHEMGHLIGSRHTHACVWNGNSTAIDGCAGGTEGSCSLPGSPSSGGTIMSYCHLTTGIDFTQGFGPQPGNVIRNTVANASCLSASCGVAGPTCSDGIQNGDETGVDCGGSNCAPCAGPCNDNAVTVTITLDNYPEETSWTITNAGGSVVASGGTYGSEPDGSTVVENLCLVDGCYDFNIFDSYGDGICCSYGNGSYTVTSSGGTEASGGSFGSSETTNFCLGSGPAPTCTDGIQNGNETGVDCGGPDCAACPTCFDGIQNGNETGVDCGGPDCAACPTCFDGIQNGDETGVDCGGPDCAPCGGGGSTVLLGSYFETGWDGWADGGSDCYRYSGSRSYEGSRSIRIRDNSGTASAMTSPTLNLSGYSTIDVEFYFYAYGMESGEDFWLRYYNGSSWTTVAAWASGTSFNNNGFYTTTVTISAANYTFPSNAQIRFQCDASANSDHIYIDQVTVTANSGALVEGGTVVTTTELDGGNTEYSQPPVDFSGVSMEDGNNNVQLFPNPAQDILNVRSVDNMQSIRVMTATGQQLRQIKLDNNQQTIDISQLRPGMYYLLIEVNGELQPQRFVKQ
ncbi:zinc-dependent metalloprotease [Lewinella cohaerens]|uniref:zinc-dependent metalloprotease n=1 Tax=Lewinella cohaerens TaxID=70995 RepID=UPI00035E8998|nr:M12 family metallo-peptidase [Lewinella cohaerens]